VIANDNVQLFAIAGYKHTTPIN